MPFVHKATRAKPITQEQIDYLKRGYADKENDLLAEELGISVFTIKHLVTRYGLRKSKEFLHRLKSEQCKRDKTYLRLNTPEAIAKRAATQKQLFRKDISRIKCGLEPKLRRHFRIGPKAKNVQRYYLISRGYIIDEKRQIAYYTANTKRSPHLESTAAGVKKARSKPFYKFKQYPEKYMKTIVTFTGIDIRTDPQKLRELQDRFPFIEFGFLVAKSRQGTENRYPDLSYLDKFRGLDLNLSCHLCGGLAREVIYTSSFDSVKEFLGDRLSLFSRIQLNVSNISLAPYQGFSLKVPENIEEVIIQQDPSRRPYILENIIDTNTDVSILFDASGGRGIPFDPNAIKMLPGFRCGVAGGLGPDNAATEYRLLHKKLSRTGLGAGFWIDMESRIRTDDWFDLEKVCDVLWQCAVLIK